MPAIKIDREHATLTVKSAVSEPATLPSLSVVVPAFNESEVIGDILRLLKELSQEYRWEVIIVDDGSTDNMIQEVLPYTDGHSMRLVQHRYNRGYGAALKTGIRQARAPYVATMDSDGQHNPCELLKLLPYAPDYDLVVGQRTGLVHSQLWRMPGKWILGWLANYLTRQSIPDLNSGMRLFRREIILKYLHLCADGFSFSTTSTLIFFNRGYQVIYQPIQVSRRVGKSTVKVSTGFETIILILRIVTLFEPLRIFLPLSLISLVLGVLWAIPYAVQLHGVSVGALLLLVTGLLTFVLGLLSDQIASLRKERFE